MTSITLPYPPSSNRYWRVNRHTGRPYRSAEATAYIEAVGWACVAQGCTEPTQETVALHLQFAHAAGRRIDLSNGIKVLEDALQGYAYAADLGKSRGITNRAARATLGELAHDVYGGFPRNGDKAGIRGFWQRRHIGKARQAFYAFFARVHRPQLAGKAELSALPNGLGGGVPTKDSNMAGRKKPAQRRGAITAHRAQPPCSRSMAREIMWR